MKNSRVAFNFLERGDHDTVGYKDITCHLILYVKMELSRKAIYVAEGRLTNSPFPTNYVSLASHDIVRLYFLISALNDLDILAGDTQNTYLNAPTEDKVFLYTGDEWKSEQGKVVIIVRTLYGLKSSDLAWMSHLYDILVNHL